MKYMLLILALFLSCFLGFIIGRLNIPTPINQVLDTALQLTTTPTQSTTTAQKVATTTAKTTPTTQKTQTVPAGGFTPKLTDAQKTLLSSFGINPDTFVITQTMITCAETKLGVARMEEIKNGAKPTFLEGAALAGCYR